MQRSTERILTTHTGSLPRPAALVETLSALERGTRPDPAAFAEQVRDAVAGVVQWQVDAGIDVVNDGEAGKVGYSTYVTERLSGFGGTGGWARSRTCATTRSGRTRPASTTSTELIVTRPASGTSPTPTAGRSRPTSPTSAPRADASAPHDVFMSAASPGVIALFLREPALRDALGVPPGARDGDEGGVRRHPRRRLRPADRLPGPRHGPAHRVPRRVAGGLAPHGRRERRGPQRGDARHPRRGHAHPPLLGQLRGAARPRRPARRHPRHRVRRAAVGDLLRGGEPAPRARVAGLRGRLAPGGQGAHPRRHRLDDELRRAPRARRAAPAGLRASSSAARTWSAARTAASRRWRRSCRSIRR